MPATKPISFTADRSLLKAAAASVAKHSYDKAQPVFGAVQISTPSKGAVELACVDRLTSGRRERIAANVATRGRVLIPARWLAQVVAAGPADTITITAADTETTIESGASTWTLPIVGDEWPKQALPDADPTAIADVDLLRSVAACTANPDKNANWSAVHFDGETAFATDTYRLAWTPQPATIDGKTAAVTGSEFRNAGTNVAALRFSDRIVAAESSDGASLWWGRLTDAQPPAWRQLVDQAETDIVCSALVDVHALDHTLRRARLIAEDHIPVRIRIGTDRLTLTVTRVGGGSFTEDVEAKIEGDPPDDPIAFNPQYLSSVVVPAGDEATIRFATQFKPAFVGADNGWTSLLMPVRM